MASLTIRKLDEAIKTYLRLRSAQNGRSVEEEVRVILRETIEGVPFDFQSASRLRLRPPRRPPALRRSTPVGSGPRHPDHRRRHRRLQVAGPDPAAQGAAHPRPLRADQGRAAIRHAAFGQRAVERACLHRPVRPRERVRRRPYPAGARLRPDRGGAGDRGPDGEDGERPCRRSRQRHSARGQPADPAGAGDEPADVEQCRDPPQRRAAAARRHRHDRAQCRRNGRSRRGRRRPDGGTAGDRRRRRTPAAAAAAAPAAGKARPDHRRSHA